mmetsp:Transcript_58352/g.128056  ORF Transcript_58352/g.128056 Transcript_58352/m.128056 type:complete len:300 (+) Transcript_58352:282-1181(+)
MPQSPQPCVVFSARSQVMGPCRGPEPTVRKILNTGAVASGTFNFNAHFNGPRVTISTKRDCFFFPFIPSKRPSGSGHTMRRSSGKPGKLKGCETRGFPKPVFFSLLQKCTICHSARVQATPQTSQRLRTTDSRRPSSRTAQEPAGVTGNDKDSLSSVQALPGVAGAIVAGVEGRRSCSGLSSRKDSSKPGGRFFGLAPADAWAGCGAGHARTSSKPGGAPKCQGCGDAKSARGDCGAGGGVVDNATGSTVRRDGPVPSSSPPVGDRGAPTGCSSDRRRTGAGTAGGGNFGLRTAQGESM